MKTYKKYSVLPAQKVKVGIPFYGWDRPGDFCSEYRLTQSMHMILHTTYLDMVKASNGHFYVSNAVAYQLTCLLSDIL